MFFCYVDESGGFEAPSQAPAATPLMALVGLVVDQGRVAQITSDFLREKRRYFPGPSTGHYLSQILNELKGSDLRRALRSPTRNPRRQTIGFLGHVLGLLEQHHVRIVGRVWVKEPTKGLDPAGSYTYAIQDIAAHFNNFLDRRRGNKGLIICDGRMWNQNEAVSHSVFTMKMRQRGDAFPNMAESPIFGNSTNHAGLQLADITASALVFPVAAGVYCAAHYASSVHCDPHYDVIRTQFARRISALEYRYQSRGRTAGGIVVSDKLGRRPSSALFA